MMQLQRAGSESGFDRGRSVGNEEDRSGTGFAGITERTYITGSMLAAAASLSFFAAIVSAYIVRRGSPAEDWRSLPVPHVLWLNTAMLVSSSMALSHSRKCFLAGDESGFALWRRITVILGSLFLVGQLVAWRQLSAAAFHLSTNPSSSFFYLLTASHGVYVLGGIAALAFTVGVPINRLQPDTAGKATSIYWYFTTCSWIGLFLLLLLIQ
jgi:cytochrome c oxidase subunit III